MAGIIPRVTVEAPPVAPLRYGLFRAAWQTIEAEPHVRAGGVQFQPDTCGVARLYTAECPITGQDVKTLTDTPTTMTADPFGVYAAVDCSPVGFTAEEHRQRAINKLITTEQTAVESALWNGGGVGATPALTLAGATVATTGALTSFEARLSAMIAEFEAAYGRQGTIHVNTRALGNAATQHLVERPSVPPEVPQILVTPNGHRWSFGAGYGVTGPANVAPAAGSVWAFMTPPVTIWQSPIMIVDPNMTMDRTTNQRYALAERDYTVAYECPTVFAVELPLENP